MSDTPQKRSTSFAKTLDLEYPQNALDRTRSLSDEFNRAHANEEPKKEDSKTAQLQETQTRPALPALEPHLRPQGRMRMAVDRQFHNEKLTDAQRRALQLKEAAEKRAKQRQGRGLSKDWERTRDRER